MDSTVRESLGSKHRFCPSAELCFWYGFLFFLPIYEAPKNIFSVLFVFAGLWALGKKYREFGWVNIQSKLPVLTGLILVLVSSVLAGTGSDFLSSLQLVSNASNWMLLPLTAIIFLMLNSESNVLKISLRVICCSSIVALAQSAFVYDGISVTLNSVGHVNQSALFAVYASLASIILLLNFKFNRFDLVLGCVTVFGMLIFVLLTRSIVAIAGFGIIFIYLIVVLFQVSPRNALGLIALVILTFTAIKLGPEYILDNLWGDLMQRLNSRDNMLSERDRLFYSGWVLMKHSLFGGGIGSFSNVVTFDNLFSQLAGSGLSWEEMLHNYSVSSHGHNLFTNVLVERGWFGVFCFTALLAVLTKRGICRFEDLRSVSGLYLVTVVLTIALGFGQTVMHNEHGQLCFVLLSILTQTRSLQND